MHFASINVYQPIQFVQNLESEVEVRFHFNPTILKWSTGRLKNYFLGGILKRCLKLAYLNLNGGLIVPAVFSDGYFSMKNFVGVLGG